MADWNVKAREVRPGDAYRSLGSGFISRRVVRVAHMCNCEARHWIGCSLDTVTHEPNHYPVVVISAAGNFEGAQVSMHDTRCAWGEVTLTDAQY